VPAPSAGPSLVVATHNLMHGRRLDALVAQYLELRDSVGLDLLCLQEDRYIDGAPGERPSARIVQVLGDDYRVVRDDGCQGLAFLVHSRSLSVARSGIIPLPRLASLSWFERRYIVGGKAKQKHALWAELSPRCGPSFNAVSFHLDTAGGHRQRAAQAGALAAALAEHGLDRRLVCCGDTNAFSWRRDGRALDELMAPFAAVGATDPETPETRPTHHFARQNEPMIPHRMGVLLGKLGLDIPLRYDVVCTNLPVASRGQVVTPGSDHDLVWARLRGN
jgi:endonuclease/exonuclease/phosphatase family metal-dependent hydrolase